MYETFENLPEDRKIEILQICIEEFAKNGYENTSTNTIVNRLGMSKGLLFLYFKSKMNLYLYLIDYLSEIFTIRFMKLFPNQKPTEFIDIFKCMGEFYKTLLQDNPYTIVFVLKAADFNVPIEVKQQIDYMHNKYHEQLLKDINMNYMRKGIDIQKVMDLLHFVSYHIGQMILKDYGGDMDYFNENADKYTDEFNQYIELIKLGIYER